MKTILIEEVSNGWLVKNTDGCSISYKLDDISVYRSIEELQANLPNLLRGEQTKAAPGPPTAMSAEEVLNAHSNSQSNTAGLLDSIP